MKKDVKRIKYMSAEGIPVVVITNKDGKQDIKAYTSTGSYDFSPFALFKWGSRICKEEYDDLVRRIGYESELAILKSAEKKTVKDKAKIKKITQFMQGVVEKQLNGHYNRISLSEELAELEAIHKKTPKIIVRMEEIQKYLREDRKKKNN
ncbi:MAG: hypothetical protein V1880_01730 [Patescibacteria group bacterium]